MIGQTIDGKYQVVRLIGDGGMGSVYESVHTGTGRRVAVKVLHPGDLTKNEGLLRRFQREAKASGVIESQHIAQVLDTGEDAETGLPFMVMELLTGEDAASLFARLGPLPPDLALKLGAQACLGLKRAHEANVVHRDIKPANLFITHREDDQVVLKILDFGIAKLKMEHAHAMDDTGLTRTGSLIGSPLYMSPEQARGRTDIDHRADLWSLGIVLYQALAGRTPYQEVTALGELILAICGGPPPPLQDFAPWVPAEIAAVVHGALRLDRDKRFQTADEMLAAIRPHVPDGWNLRQSSLIGLPGEVRAQVAPRLAMSIDEPLTYDGGGSGASGQRPLLTSSGATAALSSATSATNAGVAQTTSGAPKTSKLAPTLGALLALGLGAGLAVLVMRDGKTTAAAPAAASASAPEAAPAVSAEPAAPVEPTAAPVVEPSALPVESASAAPSVAPSAPSAPVAAPLPTPTPTPRPTGAKPPPTPTATSTGKTSPPPLDTSGFGDRK